MATRTRIRVSVNGSSTDYFVDAGSGRAALLANRQFREDFSVSQTATLLVNNSDTDRAFQTGDVITVQATASRKAARTRIRVSVNGSSTDYFVDAGSGRAALLANRQFREDFSVSQTATLLVNNSDTDRAFQTGDVITVQATASRKAVIG